MKKNEEKWHFLVVFGHARTMQHRAIPLGKVCS
jgi:hypothetical protein